MIQKIIIFSSERLCKTHSDIQRWVLQGVRKFHSKLETVWGALHATSVPALGKFVFQTDDNSWFCFYLIFILVPLITIWYCGEWFESLSESISKLAKLGFAADVGVEDLAF